MTQLGKYFTLAEMTRTSTGLENTPSPAHINNLRELVATVLDPLREHLGRPVRVNSGYRSREVNRAIGGSHSSVHMRGEAADISVPGLDAHDIVEAILLADLPYDQVIAYAPCRGGHVHIGIRAGAAARHRRHLLYAPASGSYQPYVARTLGGG